MAAWTVGTTVLPGLGLVTTRMRKLGWVLIGLLAAVVLGVAAFLLLGDPLRTGVKLVTHRGVLIALLVAAAVAMVVWMVQIVLAALAHSTAQRLERRRRFVALGLAAVMVIAVGLPFGRGVQSLWVTQGLLGSDSVFSRSGSSTLADGEDPWAGVGRINILMLGQDAGQDRTGTRPDTIMVASVDTATGKTALFSIPRNLEKVRFPEGTVAAEKFPDGFDYYGKNQNLINAVWAWAEENKDLFPGDDSPGLTATTWAVEETLGLKTDYYAQVNLQGFEDMVNAIGGVDMVVERRIPIGGGTNQATGGKYPITGYIEPGQQHLDGYHALWYARSREGSDDFNRMCRQQRMVRVVTEESNPATLAMSIPGLVTATENNIVTDIPTSDIDAFAELALRIKDSGFKSYPITQDVTPSYDADWDYLKKWTQASIEDSMQSTGAQSVTGETKAGSTEPAETGAAPDQESSSSAEEETTTEEATPTEEESSSTGDETSSESSAPVIEQDPLKSCLPGAEEGN
ncbi:LCP family protein [Brachybacterium rhamnosum]|uniref:LCP family protein n=1 Tax=Brachybacterium rhamnosum TaxID=173361 RepID=A0ABW4PT11_9MICO